LGMLRLLLLIAPCATALVGVGVVAPGGRRSAGVALRSTPLPNAAAINIAPGSAGEAIESGSGESSASQCWVDAQAKDLLLRMGSGYESKREKQAAYDNLLLSPSAPRLLDAALAVLDANEASALAKRRWSFRLPSKRAALGCYSRTVDALDDGECDVSGGFEVYGDCRRSKLLDVLRELKDAAGPPGIYALEGSLPSVVSSA